MMVRWEERSKRRERQKVSGGNIWHVEDFYGLKNVLFRVSISIRDLAGSRMVYISYLSRLFGCTYLAAASAAS